MSKQFCKDCGQPFFISEEEQRYFSQKRLGLPRTYQPVRCSTCRQIHKDKVKNLGRATIRIQSAQSGEGCFLGLTKANLPEIKSAGFTFPWHQFAPEKYPDNPTVVTFNVDNKIAGIVAFDVRKNAGLSVTALEYAPWISNYPDARRSLILYMASESIRRGFGGKFTISETYRDELYDALGIENINDSATMPARTAQKLILADEGAPQNLIKALVKKADRGDADLGWIARNVVQHKLSLEMVAEITEAQSEINWQEIKNLAGKSSLSETRDSKIGQKLQGLFGQLKTAEFLRSLDPALTMKSEMPMMKQHVDLLVKFGTNTIVRNCLIYDAATKSVVQASVKFLADQGCAVECKTWRPQTYRFPDNIEP